MTIISRRAAMRGIASTAAATAAVAVPAASAATTETEAVLEAWRAWRPLEEECWSIAAAERPIPYVVPTVEVLGAKCMSEKCIDAVCRRAPAWLSPAVEHIRECAKRELAAETARIDELNEQSGLARLERRWDEIDPIKGPLMDQIEDAAGSSPIIVAAKLDCALACLSGDDDLADCGPSGIASAIRGLLPELPDDMREKLAPIAAGEGKIRDIYTRQPSALDGRLRP